MITPLVHRIGCVVSQTTGAALRDRRVHRASASTTTLPRVAVSIVDGMRHNAVECPSLRLAHRSTAAAARRFAAEVGRNSRDRYQSIAAAAARLADRVNFRSTTRSSNILAGKRTPFKKKIDRQYYFRVSCFAM